MIYDKLLFSRNKNRSVFYTDFVATVDGKTKVVKGSGYWPIGSHTDYKVYTMLRAKADIIVQGRTTAMLFKTIDTLRNKQFLNFRKKYKKNPFIPYLIVTTRPDLLLFEVIKGYEGKIIIATTKETRVAAKFFDSAEIIRCGKKEVDVKELSRILVKRGFLTIFVDGGPTLLGHFFKADVIDEIFLTIAPKIFGNEKNSTITMVEEILLKPEEIKKAKLVSVKRIGNEVYLRYRVMR